MALFTCFLPLPPPLSALGLTHILLRVPFVIIFSIKIENKADILTNLLVQNKKSRPSLSGTGAKREGKVMLSGMPRRESEHLEGFNN